jgi:hypothetical protein
MLQIVRTNEGSEFLLYFPEYQALYTSVKAAYDQLLSSLEVELQKGENDRASKLITRMTAAMKEDPNFEVKTFLQTFDDLDLLFSMLKLDFAESDDKRQRKANKKRT